MKFLLLFIAVVSSATTKWERRIITPKGDRVDTPSTHPLSWFTQYPSLRDEDHGLCITCSPEQRLAEAKQTRAKAEVRLVGRIGSFDIFDVFYVFDNDPVPSWKSIIVRTGRDEYREIWHYQKNEGGIWPSFLVKIGHDVVLGLEDDCYRQNVIREYFWFTKDGPGRIDFRPIWAAAKLTVPHNTKVWGGFDGRLELPVGRMRVGLITDPDWRCCSTGVVDVSFVLRAGRVVVTKQRLLPEAEFHWGSGCRVDARPK